MLAMQAVMSMLTLAAGFQQTPLEAGDNAQLFVAPVNDSGGKAIFLVATDMVWVHGPPDYGIARRIGLPAETAYIDVADLDGDGAAEMIVVARGDVYTTSLATEETLHARVSIPSASVPARGPVPTYLAQRADGRVVLRVPTRTGIAELDVVAEEDGYRLVAPAADLDETTTEAPGASKENAADASAGTVDELPATEGEVATGDSHPAVELYAVTPPQVAPAEGAEYVMQPFGDIAAAPLGNGAQYQRSGTVAQARDAADRPPEDWPWFYLQGADGGRALYALDPPDFDRTLIRIAEAAGAVGPPRLYPGAIVPPRDVPPDFNGDGWADLLLWRAPAPTFSLSSLTRWAQSGRWALDLMVHLFEPATMRYDARPAAVLRTRVPLVGFLEPEAGLPVSLWTAGDFDGDERDDLLLKTEPRRLDVWLYRDGFAQESDAALRFPAAVTGIEFAGALAPDGPAVLAVRTQDGRHLVWYEEE